MKTDNPLRDAQRSVGARLEGDAIIDFGDPNGELAAALEADVIADPGDLGVISITGADAGALLQGQLTAEVRTLPMTQSRLTAWCNPQGRALALMRMFRIDDGYALVLPGDLLEATIKRLRMFVLRSRVTISDCRDTLACIGLAGDGISQAVGDALTLPGDADECSVAGDISIVRIADRRPRWLLVGPIPSLGQVWQSVAGRCRPVGAGAWALCDVLAGLPQVFAATREHFIPLTLNLDALGGIGFSKGCYTGQEIIARMKYRGHLKQRMQIGRVAAATAPAPGTRLAIAGAEMSAGEVVQSAPHPDGGFMMTAIVTMELPAQQAVHLESADGPVVVWQPLPYPLDGG